MRVLACAVVLAAAWAVTADEEKVPLDKVPAAVMAGFKKRFPDAKPTEAAKETTEDKTVVYELTFKEKGKNRDVTFTEAGALVSIEKEIDTGDLPKAMSAAVAAKYPGAKYKMVEEVTKVTDGKEKLEYYEALVETTDKKTFELEISADGAIKKTEEKKDEKKD